MQSPAALSLTKVLTGSLAGPLHWPSPYSLSPQIPLPLAGCPQFSSQTQNYLTLCLCSTAFMSKQEDSKVVNRLRRFLG